MTEPERRLHRPPNYRGLRWIPASLLAIAIVGVVVFAVSAIRYCVRASRLISSASQIQNDADARREIGRWGQRFGDEVWTETDPSRQAQHYDYNARVSNRTLARLHLASTSILTVRVTFRDSKLLCVTVDSHSLVTPVVVQEWFDRGVGDDFLRLSYVKGEVPIARVQFNSTLAEIQKKKVFAFRKRCFLLPLACPTAKDVLPVVGELAHGGIDSSSSR